jgi:hypothetical protein
LLFRHDDSAECDQVVIQTYTETAGFAPSRLNQALSAEDTTSIFRTDRTLWHFSARAAQLPEAGASGYYDQNRSILRSTLM